MHFFIKHKDLNILKFKLVQNYADPEILIEWVNEEFREFLPLDLELTNEGVAKWLKHRTIPRNRAYVNNFLSKCGLSINRPMDIIFVSMGLSLNDVYWVVEEGFDGCFDRYNLYENNFSQILALIAFTGYGSSIRSSLASCPEFTTNGNLPKCWRRESGKVYLYKGGTSGASNTGNEPYSEYYASQIAKAMGINAIDYSIKKWSGELCSVCEIFSGLDYSFVPVGRLVTKGGMEAVRAFYEGLGPEFVDALNEMLVFDAVICNTDRHFGNFGVLVDNKTNKIVCPAPLFDHGNSLFNFAGGLDLESSEAFQEYVDTLMPATYDDFISAAKMVMTDKTREQVRHLLNNKIKKNSRYNVSNERYKLINSQIIKRAKLLLE